MKQALHILITLFFATACNKSDLFEQDLTHTNLSMVWKQYRNDDRITGCFYPVIHDDKVYYSQDFYLGEDRSSVLCFDKSSGELNWKWDDYFNKDRFEAQIHFNKKYLYEDQLVLSVFNKVYCINTITGETNWKKETNFRTGNDIQGIKDNIFCTGRDIFGELSLISSNIANPSFKKLINSPKIISDENEYFELILAFEQSGNSHIILDNYYYNSATSVANNFLLKYDINKEIFTDTIRVEQQNGKLDNYPILENNFMYSRFGNSVLCVNLDSFNIKWQTSFPTVSLCSVTDTDHYVLINSEDRYLYCLNKSDGSIVWKSPSSGTVDNIVVYKEKAYLVGGGDGLLHCYDVNSGEELYTLESPDYQQNGDAFFMSWLTVDESTGRLYLASYQSAICYQIED